MKKLFGMGLLTAAAGILFSQSAMAGNIVLNPGFETGDFTDWTASDWTMAQAATAFNLTSPHGGTDFAANDCIGSSCTGNPGAFLDQALATTVGGIYSLTFWWDSGTNQPPSELSVSELDVFWGGSSVFDQVINVSNISSDPGWIQYSVTGLTASSTSTVLQFDGRQDPAILGLDDIDVELTGTSGVPEPATLGLIGIGLLGLGFVARRRNQRP